MFSLISSDMLLQREVVKESASGPCVGRMTACFWCSRSRTAYLRIWKEISWCRTFYALPLLCLLHVLLSLCLSLFLIRFASRSLFVPLSHKVRFSLCHLYVFTLCPLYVCPSFSLDLSWHPPLNLRIEDVALVDDHCDALGACHTCRWVVRNNVHVVKWVHFTIYWQRPKTTFLRISSGVIIPVLVQY